jgi:ABC-type nitrate/sulfonate/bicarbonate transport system substrate-binding protein
MEVRLKIIIIILCCLLLAGCNKAVPDRLIIGLIRPSLDHLPVQYALENIPGDYTAFQFEYFSSGWETNEALVAGKIDLAIMPFTYIWADVSQNKEVKIISFFERESDGLIVSEKITSLEQMEKTRIGVLRSSTLEIIPEMVFKRKGLAFPEVVPFRSPMEMAAALRAGEVEALSFYVPSIFNFPEEFHIIDWYGSTFPGHTCCDIAATDNAIKSKKILIQEFLGLMQNSLAQINTESDKATATAQKYYGLEREIATSSREHTVYATGLEQTGIAFEAEAAELMFAKGYLNRRVKTDEVFYPLLP